MVASERKLHRLRSALALLKMQLEIGGYSRDVLLREVEEAMALLDAVEQSDRCESDVVRDGKPVAVVVIDDEPQLADVLARRLAREGLLTSAAYDVRAARVLLSDEGAPSYSMILDLGVLENASDDDRAWVSANRPVVITGASHREIERLLDGMVVFAVVQKPFSSERLAELVRRRALEG